MKMQEMSQGRNGEAGFTLIEMMISMAMGLVIIAGLSLVFNTNSKISSAITARTERMSDLYLASQLMQAGLRESLRVPDATTSVLTDLTSRGVSPPVGYPVSDATFASLPYWDETSKTLTYQDLDGHVGIFQYQGQGGTCPNNGDSCIYWLQPLAAGVSGTSTFWEFLRDISPTFGMKVTTIASAGVNAINVTLQSTYSNEQHQNSTLSLSFKVWPRN